MAFRVVRAIRRRQHSFLHGCDLFQNRFRFFQSDFTRVMKRDAKIVAPEDRILDSALEKRTEFFIEYLHRERVAHVIVFHVTLRRVHVDGSNLRLLEPKAVNVILEPQTCWEEWRQP